MVTRDAKEIPSGPEVAPRSPRPYGEGFSDTSARPGSLASSGAGAPRLPPATPRPLLHRLLVGYLTAPGATDPLASERGNDGEGGGYAMARRGRIRSPKESCRRPPGWTQKTVGERKGRGSSTEETMTSTEGWVGLMFEV